MKRVGELTGARVKGLERARQAGDSPPQPAPPSSGTAQPGQVSAKAIANYEPSGIAAELAEEAARSAAREALRHARASARGLYRQIFAIGVVPIPNYFFDEIMPIPKLPAAHFRLLLFLWRKTIGFGKTQDWIALSQITANAGVDEGRAADAGTFWAEVGLFDRRETRQTTGYRLNLSAALEGRKETVARIKETLAKKRALGVKGYTRRHRLAAAAATTRKPARRG